MGANFNFLVFSAMTDNKESAGEVIFLPPENDKGIGFLMTNYPPYNIGKPYRFEDNVAMDNFIRNHGLTGNCSIIPGYNILVAWVGTKDSRYDKPPSGANVPVDSISDLQKMATYYWKEKLEGRSKSFLKKYQRL